MWRARRVFDLPLFELKWRETPLRRPFANRLETVAPGIGFRLDTFDWESSRGAGQFSFSKT